MAREGREASAPRNRAVAALLVLGFVAWVRAAAPGPGERAVWLYLVALPIGYGHLLGGLWLARRRLSALAPQGVSRGLLAAFVLMSVANLLAAYTWVLHVPWAAPLVLVPMLLFSAWHIGENDLALGRSYRKGRELAPLQAGSWDNAAAVGLTALLGLAALHTPEGAAFGREWLGWRVPFLAPFSLDELVTAVLLYHAVTWVHFFLHRARGLAWRAPREARLLRRRLLLVHAVPLALNALLFFLAPALYVWVASPVLYLFWSVLHAVQTALVRAARVPQPQVARV
jgi:hypothetical protein